MNYERMDLNCSDPDSNTQKKSIVEEVNALNQLMQHPSNDIYKTTALWNKHLNPPSNQSIEPLLKEIADHIASIDIVLTTICKILSQI